MTLAGLLPVLLIGASLLLWQSGSASTGDIVAAGTVSIRIAQMTGWVSFTLMQIYSNIGEVEDGMKTLTPRERVEDAPDATALQVPDGAIRFFSGWLSASQLQIADDSNNGRSLSVMAGTFDCGWIARSSSEPISSRLLMLS